MDGTELTRRLCLGTAQLGMPYGVANRTGQPAGDTALAMVKSAWESGVRYFDTAQAYGTSEQVLGGCLRALSAAGTARVISKLDPTIDLGDLATVKARAAQSLACLGVTRLWALLLHREEQVGAITPALEDCVKDMRKEGIIAHFGASVYSPAGAARALAQPAIDVVQMPASVFDRRMVREGIPARAAALGKRVFVRSVYLQGLALMEPGALPARMRFAAPALQCYADFCAAAGEDRAAFALQYARDTLREAVLVVGAETVEQVQRNCRMMMARRAGGRRRYETWDETWPRDEGILVDPSSWPSP
jgi:aryl-alcohol dehydrogenase-like predicted oxidoreductase